MMIVLVILMLMTIATVPADCAAPISIRVVQAEEILDKIEQGKPVEYDHIYIKGDLNLSKLNLPIKIVNRSSYELEILNMSNNELISKLFKPLLTTST